MYFDGSLMKTGAGAGLLFISPLGKHVRYVLRPHFPASNNVAEYEALVNGLRIAVELGVRRLDARGDTQLYAETIAESKALIADLDCLSKEALDAKRHAGNFEPAEAVKSVSLDPSNDTGKKVRIGSELDPK
jgi:ribonuclease HI